jgi:hypothetical protein
VSYADVLASLLRYIINIIKIHSLTAIAFSISDVRYPKADANFVNLSEGQSLLGFK